MEQRFLIEATAAQIEAVLLKDGAFDAFSSPATRRVRRGFLWALGGGFAFIIFTYDMPNSGTFVSLAVTVIIAQSILLGIAFRNLTKQRQQIIDFARNSAQGGPAELRVTDQGFSLTFKGAEHIERWVQVLNATLADDHILIRASTSYIFPKASMPDGDFEALTSTVRSFTLIGRDQIEQLGNKRSIGFRSTSSDDGGDHVSGDQKSKAESQDPS